MSSRIAGQAAGQAFHVLNKGSVFLMRMRPTLNEVWGASKVASSLRGNSRAAEVLIEGDTPKAYLAHRTVLRKDSTEHSFFVERVVLLPSYKTNSVCCDIMRRIHVLATGAKATHITVEIKEGEVFTKFFAEMASRQQLAAQSVTRPEGITRHTFNLQKLNLDALHKGNVKKVKSVQRQLLAERGRTTRNAPSVGVRSRTGEVRDTQRNRSAARGKVQVSRALKRGRGDDLRQAGRSVDVREGEDQKRSRSSRQPRVSQFTTRNRPISRTSGLSQPKVHRLPMKGVVYLNAIMNGSKPFEGRINGPACRRMRVGDHLRMFDRRARWGILCEIVSKDVYYSFEAMLEAKGTLKMLPQLADRAGGMSAERLLTAGATIYKGFPGSGRVTRQGCVAIGVKFLQKVY